MTIVDPSHPKAQMAFSVEGSASPDDGDELPSYDAPSTSGSALTEPLFNTPGPSSNRYDPLASGSYAAVAASGAPASAPFEPESIADLNPEMRKKLANDARDRGLQVDDYGFEPPVAELPSFEETDVGDRPAYTMDRNGNIVTHDPKLNSDPQALLRFLRLHAASPPTFSVYVRGSHTETREVTTWEVGKHGRQHRRSRHEKQEVEDFEWSINASDCVEQGLGSAKGGGGSIRGVLYPVGGWEVVHRGGPWATREATAHELAKNEGAIRLEDAEEGVGFAGLGDEAKKKWKEERWRHASLRARRKLERERREREKRGYPGFTHPSSLVDMDDDHRPHGDRLEHPALLYKSHWVDLVETHSSVPLNLTSVGAAALPTAYDALAEERDQREDEVREIVEAYCACKHQLKELVVERELYGWNLDLLEKGLRSIISRTYGGTIQIAFRTTPLSITVRPNSFLSRLFSLHVLWKLVLWIFLIYPVLLIYEFFAGRRWNNLRCAFPLTRWRRLPPLASSSAASSSAGPSSSTTNPTQQEMLALAASLSARRPPKVAQLPGPSAAEPNNSFVYMIGTQEGEWMRKWESAVVDAVRNGVRGRALSEEDLQSAERVRRENLEAMRGYSE
ncbi:hypothetical protein BCR35DRAFT_330332 [Leucosporidium creatinivorum]|uniref:Uncharacterized protein n=1 Tax=Leucosporidium creatinivorum TaxID=106004 RepID=A0A1Y2FVR4_9BASI|nr:hypothetical protein BCR35DRAFT_330332 [Leucosporidium creatinivorum]